MSKDRKDLNAEMNMARDKLEAEMMASLSDRKNLLSDVRNAPNYQQVLNRAKSKIKKGSGMSGEGIAGDVWNFIKSAVKKGVDTIKKIGRGVTNLLGEFGLTPGEALAIIADLSGDPRFKKYQKYLDAAAGATKALEARRKKDAEARRGGRKGKGVRHPALKPAKSHKVPPKGKFPNILAEPNAAVLGEGKKKKCKCGRGSSGSKGDLDANDGSKDVIPIPPPNANTTKGAKRGLHSGWAPLVASPNAGGMGVPSF